MECPDVSCLDLNTVGFGFDTFHLLSIAVDSGGRVCFPAVFFLDKASTNSREAGDR